MVQDVLFRLLGCKGGGVVDAGGLRETTRSGRTKKQNEAMSSISAQVKALAWSGGEGKRREREECGCDAVNHVCSVQSSL